MMIIINIYLYLLKWVNLKPSWGSTARLLLIKIMGCKRKKHITVCVTYIHIYNTRIPKTHRYCSISSTPSVSGHWWQSAQKLVKIKVIYPIINWLFLESMNMRGSSRSPKNLAIYPNANVWYKKMQFQGINQLCTYFVHSGIP